MQKKDILIINFAFPPFPGIGGRRWAKFVKYLSHTNIFNIHVLGAKNNTNKISNWNNDVLNLKNFHYHTFNTRFPIELLSYPYKILDKIKYRVGLFKVKYLSNGDPYDRSCLDEKVLTKRVKQIISSHNIKLIIVSIGPNHSAYFISKLKDAYPKIKFICDFRDPWIDFNEDNFYNDNTILLKELEMEKFTISKMDYILSAYETYSNVLKKKYPNKIKNIITITNGFDSSNLITPIAQINQNNDKIKFSFVGSLHVGVNHVFTPFIDALDKLKNENQILFNKLEFNFYGDIGEHFIKYAKSKHLDNLNFKGFVNESIAKQAVYDSNICLIFLMKNYEFTMSTKFYDYISMDKKIMVVSLPGEVPEIVTKTNSGLWIKPDNIYDDLISSLNLILETNYLNSPNSFPKENYDIKNIVGLLQEKLTQIINEGNNNI